MILDYRDDGQFDEIYRTLYAPLYRFVIVRCRDRALAEDITQDTFIRFLQAAPTLDGRSPLPYLHTVARNALIDHYRKKTPDFDDEALAQLVSADPSPEAVAALGEEVAGVIAALGKLSGDEEAAIRLKYLDGFDTKEISLQLGKTEESVRQLLSRGLRRVRTILDGTHD